MSVDLPAAFLDALRAERAISGHTERAYEHTLRRLQAHLGERPLDAAQVIDLRAFLFKAGRGRSAATLARHVAAIRTFYAWRLREGAVVASPADGLTPPRVGQRVPRVLDQDEAARIVDERDGDAPRELRDRAMLELLYGGGLRVSEVVGLRVEDVDVDAGLLWVRGGKGRKDRRVPVGPPACDAIRRWLADGGHRSGPLFPGRDGGHLTTRTAHRIVGRAGRASGLSGVHPHALRHTCATHMLEGGADARALQELLGHASLATTQRYTHLTLDALRAVYRGAHPHARKG